MNTAVGWSRAWRACGHPVGMCPKETRRGWSLQGVDPTSSRVLSKPAGWSSRVSDIEQGDVGISHRPFRCPG